MIAGVILALLAAQVVLGLVLVVQLRRNNNEVRRLWVIFSQLYGLQGPQAGNRSGGEMNE